MKMYLPFGDWSDDGHGKYEKILIDAPSMQHLRNAQVKIEERYGKFFWRDFAQEYENSTIGEDVQKALLETNYPIEKFLEAMDDVRFDEYTSLEELFKSEFWNEQQEWYVNLDLVIDAFVWLLNAHGAEITRLDEKEDIPMICNWTCNGFETVGYGCFW